MTVLNDSFLLEVDSIVAESARINSYNTKGGLVSFIEWKNVAFK